MIRRLILFAALAAALPACGRDSRTLRMVTTTSVENSGLLEAVVPLFERDHGVRVQVIAVGSGQAFQIARRGDADLLLTHEPLGERKMFDDGLVRYYRKVMFNRFVIAGPASDPARVRDAGSARDAMARIAAAGVLFVSRGDESGTHVREKVLWRAAGAAAAPGNLIETGQGMAATLRVAAQRHAYVLTDEATLARLADAVPVTTLYADDPVLINTYAVAIISTAPGHRYATATELARWLAEGDAQRLIADFRIGGRQVFFRWPAGVDHASPESVPGAR